MEEVVLEINEEIIRKLESLGTLLPGDRETLSRFGNFLSERFKEGELYPDGFINCCMLAIYDLQKGVNGFTGKKINHPLVGYPEIVYRLLQVQIPAIAAAVSTPFFAAEVKKIFDEIERK